MPAVSKFSYLKSVVKGSALSAIAGIPLTSKNYSLVVKLLQERFGQKEATVESLYFRLQNLPKTDNKFADIQRVSVPRQLTSDSHRPSAEVLTANSQRGGQQEGQIKASLPCIFCKGNHFNDMCDKFTTLTERKQILSQQRRCFICLKVGHVLKDCPTSQKKICCHCGRKGYHNRCLCPQKFPRQETDALLVKNQVNYLLRIMLIPLVLLMKVWVYKYS